MSAGPGTILEDDQQLYDWGIENRLDQYYQDDPNSEAGGGYPAGYYARPGYRAPPPAPPPAHTQPEPATARQQGGVKQEPGLDMSWSYSPGRPGPPPHPQHFPPFSLDANEALKVERKRARNRIAASKCRMRKIEKIQTLDQQTAKLKAENDDLAALAGKLKEQVYQLQQELQWHVNNGCQVSERATKAAELLTDFQPSNQTKPGQHQTKPLHHTKTVCEQTPDSTTVSPVENVQR